MQPICTFTKCVIKASPDLYNFPPEYGRKTRHKLLIGLGACRRWQYWWRSGPLLLG
jgi:hypothetical protein